MISRTTIENALRSVWLVPAMPAARVIFGQGQGIKPGVLFATVIIGPMERVGQDDLRGTAVNGTRPVVGNRCFNVSIQTYGPGALDAAEAALTALEKESVTEALHAAGIGTYGSISPINNLTGLLETQHEERAAFDARFGVASDTTDTVGVIERTEITETHKHPDGSTAETSTYTVDSNPAP